MLQSILVLLALVLTAPAFAADSDSLLIPDEYETLGGHSVALAGFGVAALSGLPAVRGNPAMLALEKRYEIDAGYHWPSAGREFYQVGVVDSKTSNVAAGLSYTGFGDDYDPAAEDNERDAPTRFRGALAMAQGFSMVAVGISGQMVEATDLRAEDPEDRIRGTTLGFGLAGLLKPEIRIAASVENLANRKVKEYAPQTIRAGLAWVLAEGLLTLHADFRQRERVKIFEGDLPEITLGSISSGSSARDEQAEADTPERLLGASFSVKFQNMLSLLGAYGQSISDSRRLLSGGVALNNQNFTLCYALMRPDLSEIDEPHQAVSFSLNVVL